MSVGILLVCHNDIAAELCATARSILKQGMPSVAHVSVPSDLKPEELGRHADLIKATIQQQDQGDGVLILTDVLGATPDNLSRYFCNESNEVVISGINLPMLLRVLNYANQSIEQLCETALSGGKKGIRKDQE